MGGSARRASNTRSKFVAEEMVSLSARDARSKSELVLPLPDHPSEVEERRNEREHEQEKLFSVGDESGEESDMDSDGEMKASSEAERHRLLSEQAEV